MPTLEIQSIVTNSTPYQQVEPVPENEPQQTSILTEFGEYSRLTGVWATDKQLTGWQFDRRRAEDRREIQTVYDTFVGGFDFGLTQGTRLEYWQSGVISGIDYKGLKHYRVGDFLTWTPWVTTGRYALYFDERTLYSDYSYTENIDAGQDVNGMNSMALRDDAVQHTIQVALWRRRNSDYLIFKHREWVYVDTFTGELDTGLQARLSTEDGNGDFIPANLASRKYEYTVKDDRLYLNGSWEHPVGYSDPPLTFSAVSVSEIRDVWESVGKGSGDGRTIFTEFFPLKANTLRLIDINGAGTITEWEQKDTLAFSAPTDYHFTVDEDLGIVITSGYQAPDLVLKESITEDDVEITVFVDDETMASYGDVGVITIGSELILYYGKTRDRFIDCVRGYSGTTPASHTKGDIIEDRKHGAGTNNEFYISYVAVPRVDYEVTAHEERSANKGSWLDVRPIKNVLTNNVLQIQSSQKHLAKVELETDSPSLGGNLYGPVFFGTDVSKLTARALDNQDNPVEDIELTIEILDGGGLLNGAARFVSGITNTLGEIYAFYNAPYSDSDIETIVQSTVHNGANTEMTLPSTVTGLPGNIWVYQVLKHDKLIGTVGLQRTITSATPGAAPYGDQILELDVLLDRDYKGGSVYILGSDSVKYYRQIVDVQETTDGSGRPVSTIGLDEEVDSAVITGEEIWLYESDAIGWNPAVLNGMRVILYEWSTEAEHPVTGEPGAYTPIHPDAVAGNVLTFNNINLPIPEPYNDSSNLGAYSVVTSGEVSVQAWGVDPVSNRVIRSNVIRLKLDLPSFLTGVDTSGPLPIPYGWTLVTEEFNIGAGLSGANFITINPVAELINQISLTKVL